MKYFTIAELCKSDTADRLGIDNRCKKEHVVNMTALVDNVLDPLREAYGKPIRVNSGFRCPALNKAVKERPHDRTGGRHNRWKPEGKQEVILSDPGAWSSLRSVD